jgi:glycosyltransferase involved in cell wall biosynthesis
MKILFALHQFFPEHYAGVEILTLGLARELKARGHEPYVFAAKRSFPVHDLEPGEIEDYEYEGIPVRRVGRSKEGLRFHNDRLNYKNETMAERAWEYAREIGPDVVHAMNFGGLSASVIPAFKEFGVPVVYTATDFWAICPVVDLRRHDGVMCEGPDLAHCPRCVMSRPPLSGHAGFRKVKRVLDLMPKIALRAAGRLSGTRLSNYSRPLRWMHLFEERPEYIGKAMELVDHVIAPTRLTRDLLISNGMGAREIEVSHYGIDTSKIFSAPKNRDVPPPLRVGFIGTLSPHKGCDILIRAFKSLPPDSDPKLTLYGNLERFKPFVGKLRELAGEDERITFAGTFPPERIGHVLSEIDVLIVPSRWYENTPLVVYSAFAAGTPVIATDLGGLSEAVKDEENGLLFELENVEDLGHQLRRLGEEPGLLEKLRAGIGPVKTIEENVDELEMLYSTLVEERTAI